MGLRQVVAVADPELIRQILRNRPKLYCHLGTIELVTEELGVNGVFSAEQMETPAACDCARAGRQPFYVNSSRLSSKSLNDSETAGTERRTNTPQ